MTSTEIEQASVVVSGNIAEKFYLDKYNELSSQNIAELSQSKEVEKSIKEKYGIGARIDEDGTVTYEKDGKEEHITLSVDRLASLVATQYSTKETAKAIEYSDEAID
jgi:hypothetical protein